MQTSQIPLPPRKTTNSPRGYAKAATLMSIHERLAMFRRFKQLNYQSLLYMQAEIVDLQNELKVLVIRDQGLDEHLEYDLDWWDLAHGKTRSGRQQFNKVKILRKKLVEYNTALLQQVSLAKLESPNKRDLDFLWNWFERPTLGNFPILSPDRESWDPENHDDIMAINPRVSPDNISRWFQNLLSFYHRQLGEKLKLKKPDPPGQGIGENMHSYRESIMEATVDYVVTVVAATIPLTSIVVLYLLKDDGWKLGAMVIFSAMFALAVKTMTNARKIEVFAATAAFAAVNVVFLSPDSTPSPGPQTKS
ncbi:hypothetical protein QBC38DRAFT_391334 [Podospora fimiseda]|uniref:DUF6594 domain-containing protein n=1 Tax=Podospora fimiseda TaxID=252190 RepID=A0AAN7BPV8_9PEZI|nr:hypothetical protein QBC38DRAFT_391334 [Podospora fimiseda]